MDTSTLPIPLNPEDGVFAAFNQTASHPAPLPTPNPTKSFWLDSDPSANPLAAVGSTGPLVQAADIVIIGSGITGCSAAYHLAQLFQGSEGHVQPLSTVILEARDFCSGATGRNGGHLTAATVSDFHERTRVHGVDEALRAVALERHTVSSVLDFLDKIPGAAREVDLIRGGHVGLLLTPSEVQAARVDMASAAEAGLDLTGVEWLEPEVTKERFRVQLPGIYSPGHTLWPLKLVTRLYEAAKGSVSSGSWLGSTVSWFTSKPPVFSLDLFTHAPVEAVEALSGDSGHRWLVKTRRGNVKARYVIHATNAYASHLLPHLAGPTRGIVPTRAQFSRPPRDVDEKALVVLGGGRETATPNHEYNVADDSAVNPVISQTLRKFLPRLYPGDFSDIDPEMEWTGIMGFTHSRDPMVGPVYGSGGEVLTGQYIAAGYSGHGMPRAFGCAEVLAQMIHADVLGKSWSPPDWFPRHLLTKPSEASQ